MDPYRGAIDNTVGITFKYYFIEDTKSSMNDDFYILTLDRYWKDSIKLSQGLFSEKFRYYVGVAFWEMN